MNIVPYTSIFGLLHGVGMDKVGHVYGTWCQTEHYWYDAGGRPLKEAYILASLAKGFGGGNAIELGTSEGDGTIELAKNIEPGHVWTVNILPNQATGDMKITTHFPGKDQIGKVFRAAGCTNVTQIYSDTQKWDTTGIPDLDILFVDACHDTKYVYLDTMKYWPLLKKGGIIVWHDFCPALRKDPRSYWIDAVMTGVEAFLNYMGLTNQPIHNLTGTWMAIMKKE